MRTLNQTYLSLKPFSVFWLCTAFTLTSAPAFSAMAQEKNQPASTKNRPTHQESTRQHHGLGTPGVKSPAVPENMTLEQVLDYADSPPPENYPNPVPDDRIYAFTLIEQLEYRTANDGDNNHLGWEAQGWIGSDYHKFWWKNEGESVFEGRDEGETETDLLYSRLITPFWNLQFGAQYANEWTPDDYEDRWSGVIALQGLTPYKLEMDNSLYISDDGDITLEIETEYDIRITQRLVLQPRAEVTFAFQDISERNLGAGFTDANLDLRLRYEFKRELAPYIGIRYQSLLGETDHIAESSGQDTEQFYFIAGLRFAF